METITRVKLEIDGVIAEIDPIGRVIVVKNYISSDLKVVMSITYADNWAIQRALQHAYSIIMAALEDKIE